MAKLNKSSKIFTILFVMLLKAYFCDNFKKKQQWQRTEHLP